MTSLIYMKILSFKFIFLTFVFTIAYCLVPFLHFSVFAQESSSSGVLFAPTISPSPTQAIINLQPTTYNLPPNNNQSSTSSAITTPLSLTSDQSGSSASIRLPLKLFPLPKNQFLISEPITVEVINSYDETPKIYVVTEAGREVPFFYKEVKSQNSSRKFQIISVPNLSPGKYRIQVSISTGFDTSDSFLWGTLFVNSNKSAYQPGEKADLSIGLLDENGQKVCYADIKLTVTGNGDPQDTNIIRNPNCRNHTPTSAPDYETSFTVPDREGAYTLSVTASIQGKESQSIHRTILVGKNPFQVERSAPTRLFPHASYPV